MDSQQKQVNAHDRQKNALELRKAGVGYAVIAQLLGYRTPSGAHAAVGAALKKTLQEPADDLRQLECERLDAMLKGIWTSVIAGSNESIDRALKIMARRASLLGLDAPTKIAPTTPDGKEPYAGFNADLAAQAERELWERKISKESKSSG